MSSAALRSAPAIPPPDEASGQAASDVDVLEPIGRTVRFGGREIEVMPMTVGKVPAVTRALRGVRIGDTDAAGILELVAEHGDQVLEAAAKATDIPLKDIQAAALPEFVELFAAIIEVNAAFFTQALGHLVGTLQAFGAGRTSSTGSSTPATASPT